MKEPIISQKNEREIVKSLKEVFNEFISNLEHYFLQYGFVRKKDGLFVRILDDHEEFYEIIGHRGSYLSFEISFGVRFKKFDKMFSELLGLKYKLKETNYRLIVHKRSFNTANDIIPHFDCGEKDDFSRAYSTIKYAFENFSPEFFTKNASLIGVRDYLFDTDITNRNYISDKFQLAETHIIGLVVFISFLYDETNIQSIIEHYKRLFEGRTVYKEFENFYLNKILSANRMDILKKLG